jgi:hypothetical protein
MPFYHIVSDSAVKSEKTEADIRNLLIPPVCERKDEHYLVATVRHPDVTSFRDCLNLWGYCEGLLTESQNFYFTRDTTEKLNV